MTPADRLRALLAEPGLHVMPGCFDALSARLIADAGYPKNVVPGNGESGPVVFYAGMMRLPVEQPTASPLLWLGQDRSCDNKHELTGARR